MNKKMSRYKGLILSCLSVLMIVVCVCSFSFESKAADNVYYMKYDRPSTSDTQGYCCLELQHKTSLAKVLLVFYWSVTVGNNPSTTYDSVPATYVNLDVNTSTLTIKGLSGGAWNENSMAVSLIDGSQNLSFVYSATGLTNTYTYTHDNYNIVGVQYYGNVSKVWKSGAITSNFTCVWNNERLSYEKLQDIYSELVKANANDTTMINKINQIYNSVDTVESKLQQLIDLQEESNTWLEKIWNSIQKILNPDEESKEESNKLESESNDKTDKLDDLNEQNKTDKTDIDSAANSVDENVDFDSINTVKNIFKYITENEYILQMLLLVFSVALVAYVLFGKK